MNLEKKINITTIWGWTGSYNILTWLKEDGRFNLSAIISMSDSWGSTGVLRDEFWVLPPWDIRRWILALSEESLLLRELFNYRFEKESSVSGHTIWNLLITAMENITWDFEKGLEEINHLFRVKWKVIPVTREKSELCAVFENGKKAIWENEIDCPTHSEDLKIKEISLEPKVPLNPNARNAIINSDIVIIAPWDLYTSIMPNILTTWFREAVKEAKKNGTKFMYFCNIMTKHWETNNFEVIDFIDVLEKYLWENILDYIVVNNGHISEEMVEKYKNEENKKPVKVKELSIFEAKKYKIIERDLLNENDFVRHSPKKMYQVVKDLVEGWIK